jgi:hypothetical protein
MAKNIEIGAVCISNWSPKGKKMFSDSFFYEESEYDKDIKKCDPDEVVLPPNKEYTLVIDYPVENPYKAKIKTGKKGLTRLQLADKICKHYRKMYDEEDETAGGDPGHIPGMLNRAESEGKYGIWGHDIGDLVLCSATVKENGDIFLGVDS